MCCGPHILLCVCRDLRKAAEGFAEGFPSKAYKLGDGEHPENDYRIETPRTRASTKQLFENYSFVDSVFLEGTSTNLNDLHAFHILDLFESLASFGKF